MPRSALFSNKAVGGMFAIEDMSVSTGNRFYVDSGSSTNGSTSGFGKSPDTPFSSLENAINSGALTANNGDIVYLMPGHAETVSAAAGLDIDIAGLTVQGIGRGTDQPTVTLDTADTADVDIDAANVTIRNVHFRANFADIVAAIDINSTDFTVSGCRFTEAATDMNALIWLQDAAAAASSRITVEDCYVLAPDAANTHFINMAGTGDGHVIRNNILLGDWGTMCVGGAGIVTNCTIIGNYIYNKATEADVCISMGATATGICANNMCCGGHASQGIIPGDLGSLENYYEQHTSDLSGILEPASA